jgi:hypothetical protein
MYKKLLEIQKEIGAIKKDATNPFFKSKYFDINSLLEQVKPVLNKHGVVLLQGLTHIDGKLALSTKLISGNQNIPINNQEGTYMGENIQTGDMVEFICPLPETADAQKAGSAITYFRRYALQSLLALEAEDDDANSVSGTNVVKVPYKNVATKKAEFEQNKKDYENNDIGF